MIVAGIDIGFRNTGMTVFTLEGDALKYVDSVCISTKPKKGKDYVAIKDARSAYEMYTSCMRYLRRHRVEMVIIEMPTGGARSSRAARGLAIASTLAVIIPTELYCHARFVTPADVKKAATGDKDAEKKDIIKAMTKLYPQVAKHPATKQEHVADSIGCVLAVLNNLRD